MAGSARKDSYNKKLIKIASRGVEEAGGKLTLIDIADYPIPLYNGDLEDTEGLPENAKKLKKLFIEHDGFLFSSPEYNSAISGVFKNLIDWVSRPEDSDPYYLVAYKGKVAGLLSASPGNLGGLRGLFVLRSILQNVGTHVIPDMVTVGGAGDAFDESGGLKDDKKAEKAVSLAKTLVETTEKLKS
jgi:chromate reductase, NAD(P)H dehydrogenase (quinone)